MDLEGAIQARTQVIWEKPRRTVHITGWGRGVEDLWAQSGQPVKTRVISEGRKEQPRYGVQTGGWDVGWWRWPDSELPGK